MGLTVQTQSISRPKTELNQITRQRAHATKNQPEK